LAKEILHILLVTIMQLCGFATVYLVKELLFLHGKMLLANS